MQTKRTDDLRIVDIQDVANPDTIVAEVPLSERAAEVVSAARRDIHQVLQGHDDRLIVVVGPCSIHDPNAAREYAERLSPLVTQYADNLVLMMRVYFEKPRTTVGWKGLINDPGLDDSFDINRGLRTARQLLADINEMGVAAGTEYLDLLTPQYLADLVGWGAIGARTTESQLHREMASGLSCPVGFKNGTDGNLKIAIDAVGAARHSHHFLTLTKHGHSAIFTTSGNEDGHVILRGGIEPNYDPQSLDRAEALMVKAGIPARLMVDCSHANSGKDPQRQPLVIDALCDQLAGGEHRLIGVMIESHLQSGRQDIVSGQPLTYGQSITDACIGWEQTKPLFAQLAGAVRQRRQRVPAPV
ncbi:MAG: 3-deoxy-7-phosphoheptulonate synthase [Acidiferrobacteraceae bacterium]|nr:3-deoxy-7-phosphoheptulonate synthase [Acidiferrobacteraceae bacterium]MCP4828764.1 3-deoxy-7-phosphoheptulonate synthase [Pseudomonadota bacterium]HJP06071.1 3-deoxy-7-phosphoheptulonate synthase [Arenicellales bacterium]